MHTLKNIAVAGAVGGGTVLLILLILLDMRLAAFIGLPATYVLAGIGGLAVFVYLVRHPQADKD